VSVFMRATLREWTDPAFEELIAFVANDSTYRVTDIGGRGWREFEVCAEDGATVLAADLTTGDDVRQELDELAELLEDLEGSDDARRAVADHLSGASAVVGMQILMSSYDDAVAAANAVVAFLERNPDVLTQVDTVGWYDGPDLILREPD
jgi:NAD(P)-dependent dehydrogenase (short-subunit alcohol dehydrogenase family)